MNEIAIPRPDVTDPMTEGFWAAARNGRLVISRCVHCGYRLWPPEEGCPNCLQTGFEWEEIAPRGTLWSYAVYHRALDPAFADDVPYAVGLVELEGGFKMYGILRADLDTVKIGAPVEAVFEPLDDEVTFVRWRVV